MRKEGKGDKGGVEKEERERNKGGRKNWEGREAREWKERMKEEGEENVKKEWRREKKGERET